MRLACFTAGNRAERMAHLKHSWSWFCTLMQHWRHRIFVGSGTYELALMGLHLLMCRIRLRTLRRVHRSPELETPPLHEEGAGARLYGTTREDQLTGKCRHSLHWRFFRVPTQIPPKSSLTFPVFSRSFYRISRSILYGTNPILSFSHYVFIGVRNSSCLSLH